MSILKFFPRHLDSPRDAQIQILKEVEKKWNSYDVFIISAPVALGKSAISYTIANWSGSATVVTPNNLLRNQYHAEYPDMHVIRSRREYWCTNLDQSVDKTYKKYKKYCTIRCKGCEEYQEDVEMMSESPILMGNYYGYIGYREKGTMRKTLIVDEAHNLGGVLREFAGKRLWQRNTGYPNSLKSRLDMMQWAESIPDYRLEKNGLLKLFKEQVLSNTPSYLFEITKEYHGQFSLDADDKLSVIKMLPVDTRGLGIGQDLVWPVQRVKKLVLLSATISRFDIDQFGLDKKRVCYIEAPSPIEASRRPFIIPEGRMSMAYKHQDENIPHFLNFVQSIALLNPDKKGLIHVPYNLALKIKTILAEDSRYIFHGKGKDKMAKYQEFRDADEPKILVASGMNEGIDLPGDLCRWQIIAKVPYPSLADPALRYMASKDNEWYSWQSIKDVIQAGGRVCRNPGDYGETHIYDSCFVNLYKSNQTLFPEWFKESIIWR